MDDRRKHKRLELDVSIQLGALNGREERKYTKVEVIDLSHTGVGFTSIEKFEIGTYYDSKIKIWTGETLDAVIEVVREQAFNQEYIYGGVFIGMTDVDALNIDIYEIFKDV